MITPEEFKEDVRAWADRIGVEAKEIHLRNMKKKWGSCSSKGRLTFDVSILNAPEEMRIRIVLHELLHLRYPTHGKMFKTLLKTYLGKEIGRDTKGGGSSSETSLNSDLGKESRKRKNKG